MDPDIRNVDTYSLFRINLLAFIRPLENIICSIYNPLGLKLLHRLRLDFSHLREDKFSHLFTDTVNPLCSCSVEIESTEHYFLRCHDYFIFRKTFINELNSINSKSKALEPAQFVRTILYGNKSFDNDCNFKILRATINFIKKTQRFEQALY